MTIKFPDKSRHKGSDKAFPTKMFEELSARMPAGAIADCAKALTAGYRQLQEQSARIAADETATPGARLVKTARYARASMEPLIASMTLAVATAMNHAEQLEAATAAAYTLPANVPFARVLVHQEIRQHIKSLSSGDRINALESARKANDDEVLVAIASVPNVLSAVPPELAKMCRDHLISKKAPKEALALKEVREQIKFGDDFQAQMLQSVSNLPEIDFKRAEELVAMAQDDVAAV